MNSIRDACYHEDVYSVNVYSAISLLAVAGCLASTCALIYYCMHDDVHTEDFPNDDIYI